MTGRRLGAGVALVLLVLLSGQDGRAGVWDWRLDGYLEGLIFLPGAEFDPHPEFSGKDRTMARYGLGWGLTLRHEALDRLFVFTEGIALFGQATPEVASFSAEPLVMGAKFGAGVLFSRRFDFEIRVAHGQSYDLGGYHGEDLVWDAVQWRLNYERKPERGLSAKGFLEASFYPHHGEYDPNPGLYDTSVPFKERFHERVVARYSLQNRTELRHSALSDWTGFVDLFALFGNHRPQQPANYSPDPLAAVFRLGLGYLLSQKHDLQLRLNHAFWIDLGGLRVNRSSWTGLSLRWAFGRGI